MQVIKHLFWILALLHSFVAVSQDTTLQQVDLSTFNVVDFEESDELLTDYFRGNRFSLTEGAMERIPAISLVSRGNFAPEPIYRGFSSGQVNLTIDGMHIFSACTDKMDPVSSYVETNNLGEVEAGNDIHSSANGAGLGGCIDMKTAKPDLQKKGVYGHIAAGVQSNSPGFNTSLGLGFNEKFFSGVVSATFRNNENYTDGNGNEVMYTQYSKTNVSTKLVSNFSSFHRIKIDFIYDRAWDVGYAALPMDVSLAEAKIYSLSYDRFYFDKKIKSISLKAYGNNIYHEMDDSQRPDVPIRMDMPGWSDTYGAFATLNWRKFKGHNFSIKGDAFVHYALAEMTMYAEDSDPMYMLTWPDVRRAMLGVYFSDQWTINDRFDFNYSIRYDQSNSSLQSEFAKDHLRVFGYDVDDDFNQGIWNVVFEPKFFANTHWELGWIAAFKQRLPTITEQFGFYLYNAQDGFDYIGNPELNPESALQAEMSVNYKKSHFSFSLSGFYYHLQDYIVGVIDPELSAMTIGANGVKVFQAYEGAYMTGFETSALWSKEKFSWVNVINFTYGKDSKGEILPQLPPLKLISTFTIKGKSWDLSPELVGAVQKTEVRKTYGEQPSPSWMIANLRASYFLKKNKLWTFQLGIDNIFDQYYFEFLDWGQIPRAGRNFYLNISFNF